MKPQLLILMILASSVGYAQNNMLFKDKHRQQMDSVGLTYLKANEVPGMAIGVLKGDNILYARGLGLKNKESGAPVSEHTVFHMASVSKPFVSTGIMILVEQGKVRLDDPVTKYLPYFRMDDKRYVDITIRQLLLHTAGIPDVGPSVNYEWDKPQFDDEALERHVKSLANKKLDFKPGRRKPAYSNNGYEILGDIIAKASGISFEAFMKQHILEPSKMKESSFLLSDIPENALSKPHVKTDEGKIVVSKVYPYNRKHAPSSCLHANIVDMLNFAKLNLNKGRYGETRIYSEETHRLLTEPQVRDNKIFEFGLGWTTAPYRDTYRVEFTGGDIGFDTVIIMVPTADFAIVILTNGDFNPPAFEVINTAFDLAIDY
jgi:CubicO group peptidase (beta-lactamase class C family)